MRRTRTFVLMTSLGAGALGAVLSPFPLVDEVLLFPALLGLGAVLGAQRGLPVRALPWRAMTQSAVVGLTARAAVNLPVAYVPGVAAATNAATAFALTSLYASWAEDACADPRAARALNFAEISAFFRELARTKRGAPAG